MGQALPPTCQARRPWMTEACRRSRTYRRTLARGPAAGKRCSRFDWIQDPRACDSADTVPSARSASFALGVRHQTRAGRQTAVFGGNANSSSTRMDGFRRLRCWRVPSPARLPILEQLTLDSASMRGAARFGEVPAGLLVARGRQSRFRAHSQKRQEEAARRGGRTVQGMEARVREPHPRMPVESQNVAC